MKVVSVERIPVDAGHRPRPGRHMRRKITDWSIVEVCKVTCDSGEVGWGETIPHYTWGTVTEAAVDRVIGQNPAALLWDDSLGAGLQQAMFDLTAQALDVPVYRLFGPKIRDWCPIAWWCWDMPPEDWAAEVQDAVETGYTSFKFKARPWYDLVAQVETISAATPDHVTFDLDFNSWLLGAGTAERVLSDLERFPKVDIYESPIFQWDVAGNKSLRAKINRPIAMHFDMPPFLTAMREGVCDGFISNQGAAVNRHQASLAYEANMPMWLQLVGTGITTAFAAHQGAAYHAARWPAITCLNTYADDLIVEPLTIERGFVRVPEAAGLGVTVDQDVLERLRREDTSRKTLERAIHTVQWADGRTAAYISGEAFERDFLDGNQPLFERGVTLTTRDDDGSVEFTDLYARIDETGILITNP